MRPMFRLLGPAVVTIEDLDVLVQPLMVAGLLAVLLLAADQYLQLDAIARMLWDEPPASANANLRKYATQLRRLLHVGSAPDLIVSHRDIGYRAATAPETVDVHLFHRLAERGATLLRADNFAEAARDLRGALDLWHGSAGNSLPRGGRLAQQMAALNEQREVAAGDLVEARLALGESGALLAEVRARATDQPLNERNWDQLIRVLYRTGNTGEALAAFARARQTLRDQLGIDPSARLEKLQHAVLTRDDGFIACPAH
ncbi:AfsR/SARP family transcriptional regulator [Micromonospora sp. NPDC049559]|uniref:AfsR/SARP family transcriptional regulator n=1 Tax=Micromonospora sp. NPDC049559 TaxID=3155923 RepID=UPI003430C4D0